MMKRLLLAAALLLPSLSLAQVPPGGCGFSSTVPCYVTGTVTAGNASVSATGAAVPASATYIGINNGGNLVAPVAGHGTAANAMRVELPTDGTGVVGITAGTAIIGKVSIDQTTPGTTNGVQVNAALPAGSAIIGNIRIDQTTPGTTNGVQVNAALPAGTNLIGVVGNAQASTTSGQSGPLAQGAVTTAAPSYTTAQTSPLSLTTAGGLRTADIGSSATGAAVPASANYLAASSGGTLTGLLIGAGTEAGALRVTLPTDGTGKVAAAQSGTWTVQPGNTANTTAWLVANSAIATGGATPYYLSGGSTASTNSTNIKSSAGTLYTLTVVSTSATLAYLRMYDSASAPTCSSATGAVHSYPVPASTTGAGLTITFPVGELYASGIGYCLTGGGTSTDNTNATTGIYINASYK